MDFGAYPPEVNSGRMYAGPGPAPMAAAAQSWDSVADELYTTMSGYQSVVSELTEGPWLGPSSAAMSAAAASYVEWLGVTAARAEQTAVQAWTAVAAYEAAFAATVPPAEVAANRALLAGLVATNFLGQNTPAIAATEALYAEMWAQDALAMYTYAGLSAAAVELTPFTSPHQNTDPGEAAGEAAAVSDIGGALAGDASDAMSAMSVVPQALQALSGAAAADPVELIDQLATVSIFFVAASDFATLSLLIPMDAITGFGDFPILAFTTVSGTLDDDTFSGWDGIEPWPEAGPGPVEAFEAPLPNLPPGVLPAPSWTVGEADLVGALRVPAKWAEITTATTEVRSVAVATPLESEPDSANMLNQMAIGAMAGQSPAGRPAAAGAAKNGSALRLTGRTGDPAAEDVEVLPAPRTVMTGVAAAIRDIAVERAAGRLSEREYTEQKKRLLDISFGQ